MLSLLAGAGLLVGGATLLLALLLCGRPQVPAQLSSWPPLGFLYLQLLRAAVRRKAPPTDLRGKPIKVALTVATPFDLTKLAAFLKLAGFKDTPPRVPLSYPFVESFRLAMLAMSHPDFPFPVLGAVLARNSSTMLRPLGSDEALTYSTEVDPNYVKNDKGDYEIVIRTSAADKDGKQVWVNSLTVIVINPKRQRGGGSKPAAQAAAAAAPARTVLAQLSVPGNAGRAYGALTGDRNPIHLSAATSRLFGFSKPIAHAMYLVARMEAALSDAGFIPYTGPQASPLTLATEFRRPTPLPARLQAVVEGTAATAAAGAAVRLPLGCGVLTGAGDKDVIVGRLSQQG